MVSGVSGESAKSGTRAGGAGPGSFARGHLSAGGVLLGQFQTVPRRLKQWRFALDSERISRCENDERNEQYTADNDASDIERDGSPCPSHAPSILHL